MTLHYLRYMNSSSFFQALFWWRKSFTFIREHKLLHYFLYPLIVAVVLFAYSISWTSDLVEYMMQFAYQWTGEPMDNPGDDWKQWAGFIGDSVLRGVLWIFSLLLMWKISKYTTLILMSPLLSLLSARVDSLLTGVNSPFSIGQLLKDMIRGIALSVRNLCAELFFIIILGLLNILFALFFPVLDIVFSPLSLILSFLIGSYYSGGAIIDYALENKRFSYRSTLKFLRENKSLAIGFGAIYSLLFRIPFLGIALAIVTCTVGSSMLIHEWEKSGKLNAR